MVEEYQAVLHLAKDTPLFATLEDTRGKASTAPNERLFISAKQKESISTS